MTERIQNDARIQDDSRSAAAELAVEGLSYAYGPADSVFSDVSFELGAGEILSILGPNGAGKSTLLNCIAGFLKPARGRVLVKGADVRSLKQNDLALRVAYVPQMQQTTFGYAVRDYVVMGRAPHVGLLSTPGREAYAIVDRTLEELGMIYLADKPFGEISGGERQQVEIARVVVQDSAIVLLDEPANHLDLGNQIKVLRTLKSLADGGRSVVLTTHNPDHCTMLGGYVAIMDGAGSLRFGRMEDVVSEEALCDLYRTTVYLEQSERAHRRVCYAAGL